MNTKMTVYNRLRELNIALPAPPPRGGLYAPVKIAGKLVFVSGVGAAVIPGREFKGKVGADLSLEEASEAAASAAVNILSVLDQHVGLDKIESVVKIFAMVQSAPGFNQQPQVINAASRILNDVFPEGGGHARMAVGTNELPGNIPVEIEGIFKLY